MAKAIRDGGIDAVIDSAGGFMASRDRADVYSSGEPQAAFHARIAFCLDLHNEAIKAMRFDPDAHRWAGGAGLREQGAVGLARRRQGAGEWGDGRAGACDVSAGPVEWVERGSSVRRLREKMGWEIVRKKVGLRAGAVGAAER